MLVSGFFRLPNDIPKPLWRYPMSYISFHFWAVQVTSLKMNIISIENKLVTVQRVFWQGQYQNDLKGLFFDNQIPGLPKISGEYVLMNVFQINVHRSKWLDLSVLFCMIIIYRVLFFVMIKISEDISPWIRGYIARRKAQMKSDQISSSLNHLANRTPSFSNYVTNLASTSASRWLKKQKGIYNVAYHKNNGLFATNYNI